VVEPHRRQLGGPGLARGRQLHRERRPGFLADGTFIGLTGASARAFRLGAGNTTTLDLDLHTDSWVLSADRSGAFLLLPSGDGDAASSRWASSAPAPTRRAWWRSAWTPAAAGSPGPQHGALPRRHEHRLAGRSASDSGTLVLLKGDGATLTILEDASSNFLFYGDRHVFGTHANGRPPYGWLQDGPYLSSPPWPMGAAAPPP